MTLIGYFLGQIPGVREHIEIVIIIVIFLSILPGIIAAGLEWRKKRHAGGAGALGLGLLTPALSHAI